MPNPRDGGRKSEPALLGRSRAGQSLPRNGRGQTGLEKLRLTAEKGLYLKPFARLLLAVAALRDKDRVSAKSYLSWLVGEFPQNRLYRDELAKLR